MAESPSERGPRRSRPPVFQPRFTVLLFYMFFFFALYCLLVVMPSLLDVLREVAPGPQQQEAAARAAQAAIRGKLLICFLLALATVGVGAYYRVLPGSIPS